MLTLQNHHLASNNFILQDQFKVYHSNKKKHYDEQFLLRNIESKNFINI